MFFCVQCSSGVGDRFAPIHFDVAASESVLWNKIRHQHAAAEVHDPGAGWNAYKLELTPYPVILNTAGFRIPRDQMHHPAAVAHDAELDRHGDNYPTSR